MLRVHGRKMCRHAGWKARRVLAPEVDVAVSGADCPRVASPRVAVAADSAFYRYLWPDAGCLAAKPALRKHNVHVEGLVQQPHDQVISSPGYCQTVKRRIHIIQFCCMSS